MENPDRKPRGSSIEARLKKYGLGLDAMNAESLKITPRSKVRLDATGKGLAPSRWLRPAGIAQLKEWLGVPQSVVSANQGKFNGRRARQLPPTEIVASALSSDRARAKRDCSCSSAKPMEPELKQYQSATRELIRQYIFGDASELKPYEKMLDLHIALDFPFWIFTTVVVEGGGVLEFGAGSNSLVADTLIIETGGEIRCEGSLKIDCRRIARS